MTCSPSMRAGLALACTWMLAIAGCGDGGGTPPVQTPDAAPRVVPDAMPDDNADLADLRISRGTLAPVFAPHVTAYQLDVSLLVTEVAITPTADSDGATITINGTDATSGEVSAAVPLDVGENEIAIEVTAEAGNAQTYTITVTRTADAFDQRYTKPDAPAGGGRFGFSVAITGDYLAAGVPFEGSGDPADPADTSAPESGAVYVFRRDGGTWVQDAYLKAANLGEFDKFGTSVALSGDTLAVGASGESSASAGTPEDDSALDSGAVYVFRRGETGWQQEAYIKADNIGGNDAFGTSAALDGDVLAAGAPGEASNSAQDPGNNSARNSGAVYVFRRSGTDWQQEAYLKADNLDAGDALGTSVALDGDVLVAGAAGEASARQDDPEDDTELRSGAVYVFRHDGADWQQEAYLKAENAGADDAFGTSVAAGGDMLVAGAPGEDSSDPNNGDDNGASGSGAAYVFQRTGAAWSQVAYLKAPAPQNGAAFGTSTALAAGALAAGAPGEDREDTLAAGVAYLYLVETATWLPAARLGAPTFFDDDDAFGTSVALAAGALAAGVTGEDSGLKMSPADGNAPQSGAVYLFE